jgi:hypothetical protein
MKKRIFSLVICLVLLASSVMAKDPDYMYSTCPTCHMNSHVLQPYATKHDGAAHIKWAWNKFTNWVNSFNNPFDFCG